MLSSKTTRKYLISPIAALLLFSGCSLSHPSSLTGEYSEETDSSEAAWTRIPRGQMRIVVSPDGTKLYVLRNGSSGGTLSILNSADGTLLRRMSVGADPIAMALDGSTGYVANYGSDDMTVIDLKEDRVIRTVRAGSKPIRVLTSESSPYVLVANYGSDTVSVIDKVSGQFVKNVRVGLRPADMAFDDDAKAVFVVNRGGGSLSVVSLDSLKVLRSVPAGEFPSSIALSEDGRNLYVTDAHMNTVTEFDAASLSVKGRIAVGGAPMQVLASSAAPLYFVMNHESNSITVIDGIRQEAVFSIPLRFSPRCMTITPDGKNLYVSYGEKHGEVTMIKADGNPPWPSQSISPVF